jgi:hypothetical protein
MEKLPAANVRREAVTCLGRKLLPSHMDANIRPSIPIVQSGQSRSCWLPPLCWRPGMSAPGRLQPQPASAKCQTWTNRGVACCEFPCDERIRVGPWPRPRASPLRSACRQAALCRPCRPDSQGDDNARAERVGCHSNFRARRIGRRTVARQANGTLQSSGTKSPDATACPPPSGIRSHHSPWSAERSHLRNARQCVPPQQRLRGRADLRRRC